jgi:hypothetical protein
MYIQGKKTLARACKASFNDSDVGEEPEWGLEELLEWPPRLLSNQYIERRKIQRR